MDFSSRKHALARCVGIFTGVQALAGILVWRGFSEYVRGRLMLHVLLGPLNVFDRLDRLKYHSFLSNAGFLLLCAAVAVLPLIHWRYPRRSTLVLAVLGSLLWALFGAGFSIRHM